MKPILEINNISKKFRIRHTHQPYLNIRDSLLNVFRREKLETEDFWALRDISFNVEAGESVGIIGKNGAGKSTMLKILSKITPPTKGYIDCRGRVASLLEVGTGFHPELTGRENIFLNGSILGMTRKEIKSKFDEIVDFSGTEKFLDTPLKHYSSGMSLRLAFAVAAFLEPEILVIDEVLAVGDAEFQQKCLGKMEDVTRSGRTVLFVSHNMTAVENLCSKSVLLKNGQIEMIGDSEDVINHYHKSITRLKPGQWKKEKDSGSPLSFESIDLNLVPEGNRYILEVDFVINSGKSHRPAFITFDIINSFGITIMQSTPDYACYLKYPVDHQRFKVRVELPALIPDTYKLSAWVGPHFNETYEWLREIMSFEITNTPEEGRTYPYYHKHGFVVPRSTIEKA